MDYSAITLDITDNIAVITLNRPDKMNALNAQMRAEVTHAIKDAETRARVIVLTGAGGCVLFGSGFGRRWQCGEPRPRAGAARRICADAERDV